MKKPTKKEIEKARSQVHRLFTDKDWFEVMRHWQGECWNRDQVMCGLLVGMKIVENRQSTEREELTEILANITSPGECRLDHHGYCQSHGWMSEEKCPHGRAREILK